jgi:LmbE family N-acetylglucosaminyl deacetylase
VTRLYSKTVALIVAHPDDETLWAGGTILNHPSWKCFIVCLCRRDDKERSGKFYNALKVYGADGIMGDLDDGPDQIPLNENELEDSILKLLPPWHFDLVISHNPRGEYTRHLRHEETGKAVIRLWKNGKISSGKLWIFAYEDGNRLYYPTSVKGASIHRILTKRIWLKKYKIITGTYGFGINSFEAETTPEIESFWQLITMADAENWLKKFDNQLA